MTEEPTKAPAPRELRVTRKNDVKVDGETVGYVVKNADYGIEGILSDGRVVCEHADSRATAASLVARRSGALKVGDRFVARGEIAADGGPWTLA